MSRRRAALHLAIAASVVAATTSIVAAEWPMSATLSTQTQVYRAGDGVSLPAVVHEVKPVYTRAAMQEHIQGEVLLSIVVLESGDVGEVAVTKSLDAEFGLDEQAVGAAKEWKFRPGTKDGKPVAVQVELQMTFTLK